MYGGDCTKSSSATWGMTTWQCGAHQGLMTAQVLLRIARQVVGLPEPHCIVGPLCTGLRQDPPWHLRAMVCDGTMRTHAGQGLRCRPSFHCAVFVEQLVVPVHSQQASVRPVAGECARALGFLQGCSSAAEPGLHAASRSSNAT